MNEETVHLPSLDTWEERAEMAPAGGRKRRKAAIEASEKIQTEIESVVKQQAKQPKQKKRKKDDAKKQGKKPQQKERINKSMPILELFFASLLTSSSYKDFERANVDEDVRNKIVSDACWMINLPLPGPLPPIQATKADFYNTRAALVIEEARAILSSSVADNIKDIHMKKRSVVISLISVKTLKSGNLSLTFERSESVGMVCHSADGFSPSELYTMKQGCCFELMPITSHHETNIISTDHQQEVIFPIIAPIVQLNPCSEEGDLNIDTRVGFMCFQRGLFHTIQMMPPGTKWTCRPLTSLIGHLRQFEVCKKAPYVEFLPSLLGANQKLRGTYIRFNNSEKSISKEEEEVIATSETLETNDAAKDSISSTVKMTKRETHKNVTSFKLPTLNQTQQSVVDTFLSSKSILSLVQGPPGTGKSELIVSLLFQCLLQSKERRIMVCAPTNKVSNLKLYQPINYFVPASPLFSSPFFPCSYY